MKTKPAAPASRSRETTVQNGLLPQAKGGRAPRRLRNHRSRGPVEDSAVGSASAVGSQTFGAGDASAKVPDSIGGGSRNYQRIYRVVGEIPRGRIASYGEIAARAGLPGHARQVGYAMYAIPKGVSIPWHRVVNARGQISARSARSGEDLQRALLEGEGVEFDATGRIDFSRFGWRG